MGWDTVSHVVIHVKDIEISRHFYDKLCKFLKMKTVFLVGPTSAYANNRFSIWISQKSIKKIKPKRGSTAGYDHIAFSAPSKKEVDDLQKLLKKEKFKILYPAEAHPEYAPGYYSVSFFDPDSTIIEFVYLPKTKNAYG